MAARLASRWPARTRPRLGTRQAAPMAALRSRIRPACAAASCISPICAIPTATNWSGFAAYNLNYCRSRLRRAALGAARLSLSVLQPVAEPHGAALQDLAADQRHRAKWGARLALIVIRVEDMRPASGAVDGRADRQA